MGTSGVYIIINPENQVYVGASRNIEARWRQHKCTLGKAHSQLRLSFMKYGYKNHQFKIVETCPEEVLPERERHWQDHYEDVMLNCRKVGTKKLRPWTCESTRELQSKASKGRKGTMKDRKHSEETKAKMSRAKQGKGRLIQRVHEQSGEVLQEARLNEYLAEGYSRQAISMACRGIMPRYKGFLWRYRHKSAISGSYQPKTRKPKTMFTEPFGLF